MIRVERDGEVFEIRERIPLLPLRDIVIYPYMTIPLLVGRRLPPSAAARATSSGWKSCSHKSRRKPFWSRARDS
jgi:ATP-dependent Lon protease